MAFSNAGPYPPVRNNGQVALVSSFGLDNTQLSQEFPATQIVSCERFKEMEYRSNFYECKQHDHKVFDWNSKMRRPSRAATQPLISSNEPDVYVPLESRRPHAPYRLARTIVGAFTTLIFGHGRWPTVLSDDPETQDFADALIEASRLKIKMINARNLGGACGTVGISWGFKEGKPRVRVHQAKRIHVAKWEDEDELIPEHVIELYQYPKDIWNPKASKYERKFFWHRRDWTSTADVCFEPVEVTRKNPNWAINEEKSHMHNHGRCHFVWVQNLPDDDTTTIDGQADYAELYEQLDSIDILNSTNVHGTIRNLDPTLKLKMEQEDIPDVIRKGSTNAISVGLNGDASYMELAGTAVAAGQASIEEQRRQALETCQCIVPDPNEVVGSATSSIALKIVYAPMLSKGDIQRDQYGENAIKRLLEDMIDYARQQNVGGVVEEESVDEEGNPIIDESTGQPLVTPVEYQLNLAPRKEKVETVDEEGNPTGEFEVQEFSRLPGSGVLTLEWPDYFKATAEDRSKQTSALNAGTGGKPILSQQTAVEQMATSMQRNPQEEWARIRNEQAADREAQAEMFPGVGGEVGSMDELPAGADEIPGENNGEPEPTDPTED